MGTSDWLLALSLLLSAIAIGVTVFNAWRQRKIDGRMLEIEEERHVMEQTSSQEAAEVQRRLLAIEEERHAREQQAHRKTEEHELAVEERERLADELSRTAGFSVRFAYRDSKRTWARLIARNNGPADAHNVDLEVWGERNGDRMEANLIQGMDFGTADALQPGETVHVGIAFAFGSPVAEELRYRLTWIDGRDQQVEERQVPSL